MEDIRRITHTGEYDFCPSKLAFGKPRTLQGSGARIVPLTYDSGPLCFESPSLRAPMGVSCWETPGETGTARKFSLMLSLSDGRRPEVAAFVRAMRALDAAVARHVASRVREILDKDLDSATVAQLQTPVVRPSDRYGPSMKVTLPLKADGASKAYECFDTSGPGAPRQVDVDDLETRGAGVRAIFSMGSIWVAGKNSFGVSARAAQIAVQPAKKLTACAFADLGDD
jgi:hypothetical protein